MAPPPPVDKKPASGGRSEVVLGVPATGPALSKAQKRFNQLVEKLNTSR
jgi:hypothetical protein